MNGRLNMSRNKEYQRLLNSPRWKTLRTSYLQEHPLCELCKEEGHVRSAIDCHHKVPVESAQNAAEMERLCFAWNNLQALCIPHHIQVHAEARSHTREAHQKREADRLERWKARMRTRPGSDAKK